MCIHVSLFGGFQLAEFFSQKCRPWGISSEGILSMEVLSEEITSWNSVYVDCLCYSELGIHTPRARLEMYMYTSHGYTLVSAFILYSRYTLSVMFPSFLALSSLKLSESSVKSGNTISGAVCR